MPTTQQHQKWREVITPVNNLFTLNLKELWDYRDLLFILIRRDLLATYKQTILGPLWFILQPVVTTLTFIIIFSRLGRQATGNISPVLFYLSGLVLWSYFSECILRTSNFFKDNAPILTKVYFPRLIVPLSLVFTNLVKFSIQLTLFFLIYAWFMFAGQDRQPLPNQAAFLLPILILLTGMLGLGLGLLISSLTTKYKDLIHLLSFGVQLLMFLSPVIFPLSGFGNSKLRWLIMANPMTGIIEAFRYGFLGEGYFSWQLLAYDGACVASFLLLGIIVFNSIEKNFADSI